MVGDTKTIVRYHGQVTFSYGSKTIVRYHGQFEERWKTWPAGVVTNHTSLGGAPPLIHPSHFWKSGLSARRPHFIQPLNAIGLSDLIIRSDRRIWYKRVSYILYQIPLSDRFVRLDRSIV